MSREHGKPSSRYLSACMTIGIVSCLLMSISNSDAQRPNAGAAKAVSLSTPEGVLSLLTLEEKVGQMLQIRFYADSASPAELPAMVDQLTRYHIGSLDLGARMAGPNLVRPSLEQVATTIAQLQKGAKVPLLVGGDLERGLALRLSGVPDLPTPMALGAIGDPQMVERVSALTAKEARTVGLEWAFAPVADINSNPDNPIINTRSFGDDPAAVAKLVAAYIRGAHSAARGEDRMAVAVKHFPGEGDTAEDPHTKVTKITADAEHLRRVELVPFRAAIAAGADSVMLAQAAVPALDADTNELATRTFEDGDCRRRTREPVSGEEGFAFARLK